jgi:hypothetical protein
MALRASDILKMADGQGGMGEGLAGFHMIFNDSYHTLQRRHHESIDHSLGN